MVIPMMRKRMTIIVNLLRQMLVNRKMMPFIMHIVIIQKSLTKPL